ncbi:DUF3152 domain-containing protein [Streptomyces mayteni]
MGLATEAGQGHGTVGLDEPDQHDRGHGADGHDEPRQAEPARRSSSGRHGKPRERRRGLGDSRVERRGGGGGGGGWGRTLTGVAAAAVVTVLTVVVGGNITDRGGQDRAGADEGAPDVGAGAPESDTGRGGAQDDAADPDREGQSPSGSVEEPQAEPTYEELMTTAFELDPELTASGQLVPVGGSDPAADPTAVDQLRYRVDVEEGMGLDAEFFAQVVHQTLNDPRSWGNNGERSFARVSAGEYDFVITLASPGTAADWCARSGLDITQDNVSCDSSNTERVIINAWRWAQGSETYGDDISGYRQMLINHEVGHRLGLGHAVCPAEGALAPVMLQQTKYLTTNGVTCVPNPWPNPER